MHNIDRRHDHARRAIAALQPVIIAERGLHRMQLVALRDALDGGDVGAIGLADQYRAGFDRAAIEMHDPGAARAVNPSYIATGPGSIISQGISRSLLASA